MLLTHCKTVLVQAQNSMDGYIKCSNTIITYTLFATEQWTTNLCKTAAW